MSDAFCVLSYLILLGVFQQYYFITDILLFSRLSQAFKISFKLFTIVFIISLSV